jgi:hypothetical protein
MLAVIARYQSLPAEERMHFRVGRRSGIYGSLDELYDSRKRETVDGIIDRLSNGTGEVNEDLVHRLRQAYT